MGKAPLPAPLALLGAIAVAGASLLAAWRWRLSRLAPAEAEALTRSWRRLRRRGRLPLALSLGALLALAVTAVAAGSGAGQAPPPVAGAGRRDGDGGQPHAVGGHRRRDQPPHPRPLRPPLADPPPPPDAPLPAAHVTALAAAPGGEVWVATHGGLARYQRGRRARRAGALAHGDGRERRPPLPHRPRPRRRPPRRRLGRHRRRRGDDRPRRRRRPLRALPRLHRGQRPPDAPAPGRRLRGLRGAGLVRQRRGRQRLPPGSPRAKTDGADEEGEWVTGFNRVSTAGRLPDNQVYTVLGDSRGRIWFGTAGGAAALTPDPDGFGLGAFEQSRWMTLTRPAVPLAGRRGARHRGGQPGTPLLRHQERDLGAGRIPAGPRPALAPAPIQVSRRDCRGTARTPGCRPSRWAPTGASGRAPGVGWR